MSGVMTGDEPWANNRLLIVDRCAEFRQATARALSGPGKWTCLTVSSAREALEKMARWAPGLVILEHELPENSNGELARQLQKQAPAPLIGLQRTREPGAGGVYLAVVQREADGERTAREVVRELARVKGGRPPTGEGAHRHSSRLIAIGASTGGTEAVEQVLVRLPAEGPGIVIAQHIPPRFSTSFAERLNRVTALRVREAIDGDVIRDGEALVAPGDWHMRIGVSGTGWEVRLDQGPKVWHQRPAVDVLFESVARYAAGRAVGVLMTGMGRDGAAGLGQMRKATCWTIAQDEATCVVFGMPRAAIEADAACEVLGLPAIAAAVQSRSAGAYLLRK